MLPEPVRQVGLLYERWRHYRPPQFRHGTGGEGNILQAPALLVSVAIAQKTFGPTDLTSTPRGRLEVYRASTPQVRVPFPGCAKSTQPFIPTAVGR
ncbi:uncharacterized protein TNCV_1667481 [Trichonephila clavipes]|nr:uncharacterized protein TNCV_1667481 [Trichonephila clavipes]